MKVFNNLKRKLKKVFGSFILFLFYKKVAFGMTFYGDVDISSVVEETNKKEPIKFNLSNMLSNESNILFILISGIVLIVTGIIGYVLKIDKNYKKMIISAIITIGILSFLILNTVLSNF